jgi:hypothetical protein
MMMQVTGRVHGSMHADHRADYNCSDSLVVQIFKGSYGKVSCISGPESCELTWDVVALHRQSHGIVYPLLEHADCLHLAGSTKEEDGLAGMVRGAAGSAAPRHTHSTPSPLQANAAHPRIDRDTGAAVGGRAESGA